MVCGKCKLKDTIAMVFETLGTVNVEGEEVLRQLFRFAAQRLTHIVVERGHECRAMQRSVSQAFKNSSLNRIDGREFPDNICDA